MNRITVAINNTKQRITERLTTGLVTQEKLNQLHKTLNMELMEYVRFQELKSLASVNSKLTLEEANTVYSYLGNTVEHFNKQPVEVKSVLTQLFAELLKPH